jgi:SAM-dependent methyltransferase
MDFNLNTADQKLVDVSRFYSDSNPTIPNDFAVLLETYSSIPRGSAQASHVKSLRDEAYKVHHYPCLGLYRFLNLSLSTHPLYKSHVLPLLKSPPKDTSDVELRPIFLDFGTCLGQDLRKLIYDGASPTLLYGSDVLPAFITLGYDLFRDRETFPPTHFLAPADAFDTSSDNALATLGGRCAIVHASAVFHLFNYPDQVLLAKRIVRLLQPRPGSLILGHQNANKNCGEYPSRPGHRSETLFRHNEASWQGLWERVGREMSPKVRFRVKSALYPYSIPEGVERPDSGQWRDEGFSRMRWEVWWEE